MNGLEITPRLLRGRKTKKAAIRIAALVSSQDCDQNKPIARSFILIISQRKPNTCFTCSQKLGL